MNLNLNPYMNIEHEHEKTWTILATNVEMIKWQIESYLSHERETAESQAWDCIEKIRSAWVKMNLNLNINMRYYCN